jgi:hypothetical protein
MDTALKTKSNAGISVRGCKQEHREGMIARSIEEQTAKLPSDIFMWAAFACIGLGAYFELTGRYEKSRWIGEWPTNIMLLGLYNKLVKVAGSDSCS